MQGIVHFLPRAAIALSALTVLAACGSHGPLSEASSATRDVTLRFAGEVGEQPFACGQVFGPVGRTGATVTPSDFRFFVSELRLLTTDGHEVPVQLAQDGVWQHADVALIDFEDGSGSCRNGTRGVNTVVRGRVPAGDYRGVRFTLGVPFALNHGDPTVATAPLNGTSMFWNWQGGYKFLKFDAAVAAAKPVPEGATRFFSVHLGSTVCAGPSRTSPPQACQNPNRVSVELPDFDPQQHVVVADIGRVLAGADVTVNAPKTSAGCMSFPGDADCPPVMGALGLPYGGVPAPGPQQLFQRR